MSDPAPGANKKPGKKKQVIAGLVTLVTLVVVFAVVLPQFADYGAAWDAVLGMSAVSIVVLIVVTVVNIVVYQWPYQAAIPGISFGAAFMVRQTSYAISNAIPGGGTFGLGVQYTMLSDYGVAGGPAAAAIGVTTVWNTLVTLALPVLAVVGIAATGDLQPWVVSAAVVGLIAVAIAVAALVLIFRSEGAARWLGGVAETVVAGAARLVGKRVSPDITSPLLTFRTSTDGLIRRRVVAITVSNTVQQLAQFAVLYVALRGIQGEVHTIATEAFVAYAVGRLGGFIPLTPGGLGTVDALITAILVAFGADEAQALAAALVWRAATYFPQMLLGIGTFLVWRRRREKAGAAA
jgi:uncharacterized protein (TIRG00374 family)